MPFAPKQSQNFENPSQTESFVNFDDGGEREDLNDASSGSDSSDVSHQDEQGSSDALQDTNSSTDDSSETLIEDGSNDESSSSDFELEQNRINEVAPLRRFKRTPKPKQMPDYVAYATIESNTTDPITVYDAMHCPEKESWEKAMKNEFESLQQNTF